jgi:uncharacterized protein (AIM24 family)
MAAGKRGLKRGLATRERTVILMLDETIILLHGYLKQLLTSAISGEGVVLRLSGEGKVLICSRNRDESHTSHSRNHAIPGVRDSLGNRKNDVLSS